MTESSKSKMLQDLVEDILNETIGEDEKENKNAVNKAVKNIIMEIYGDMEFTEEEIDTSVDKYFAKLEGTVKEKTAKINDDEEISDIFKDIENQGKEMDMEDNFDLDIDTDIDTDTESFEFEDTDGMYEFFDMEEELSGKEEIFQVKPDEKQKEIDNKKQAEKQKEIDNKKQAEKQKEIDNKKQAEKQINVKKQPEKEIKKDKIDNALDGRSFYEYISEIREKVLTSWEDEHSDMTEQFEQTRENLRLVISALELDLKKHKGMEPITQNKLNDINQDILNMINLFKNSVEELIRFLNTEDPTYNFSSKKYASNGNEMLKQIGEKLEQLSKT